MTATHNPDPVLERLFALRQFGMKLGLGPMRTLLEQLGNPHIGPRFIHIAGTNGKGSTAAICDAALRAAGIKTGLYTSPHLVWFGERMRYNGASATPEEIHQLYTHIEPALARNESLQGQHPTFFEVTTAMALLHFRNKGADWIIWETGMGGRLDATNVVTPALSIITPISYDHCKWLGDTLAAIASEKAGIIKPTIPILSAPQHPDAAAVIARRAAEQNAPLHIAPAATNTRQADGTITIHTPHGTYPTNFLASYQTQNASLAIHALHLLRKNSALPDLTPEHLSRALLNVRWPARMDALRRDPWLIIDGAHNPDGAAALATSLQELHWPAAHATLITASLADKDAAAVARLLAPLARRIICTQVSSTRTMSAHDLAQLYRQHSTAQVETISPEKLPALLHQLHTGTTPVLIAGSLYLAGLALATLRGCAQEGDPAAPPPP